MPLIPTLTALLLAASEPAETPSFRFDRVDLISEEPGTWLHYDVPLVGAYPLATLLRFVEQVKPVFQLPVKGLYVGTSISTQSLVYEGALMEQMGLSWTVGLQTRLLFPTGLHAGVAWRFSRLRVGLSLSAFTNGGWGRPDGFTVQFLPTLGVGIG
jgi:hypothetical protein